MGSLVTNLLSGGIQGAGQGIAAVINAVKGKNPEDAAKLAEIAGRHADLIAQLDADQKKAETDANVRLNETAGGNIQAEAKSGWAQAFARPSVIYMGNLVLIWNFIVRPSFARWSYKPIEFPEMFWYVWCACVLGYVVSRTGQDIIGKVVGGQGGAVQLPGMKFDSKGD